MKTIQVRDLFIVRHGHSPFEAESDHKRILSLEGKMAVTKSAQTIRHVLQQEACQIACSDASRTEQTAQIIEQQLNCTHFSAQHPLYSASVGQWQDIILNGSPLPLILVGHNPTMGLLASQLSQSQLTFSPACMAHLKLEIKKDGLRIPATLLNFFNPNQ